MSQCIKWLTKEEINKFNVNLISKNSLNGYIYIYYIDR